MQPDSPTSEPVGAPPVPTPTPTPAPAPEPVASSPAPAALVTFALVPGQQVMAKVPAANAQYEVASVVGNAGNPDDPFIEFRDGLRYYSSQVHIGGPVAPPPLPTTAAPLSRLTPEYESFKKLLVELDKQSKRIFELPLDVLITVVYRYARQEQLTGSGQMDANAIFVPDEATFDRWVEAYLAEIQRREAGSAGAEG